MGKLSHFKSKKVTPKPLVSPLNRKLLPTLPPQTSLRPLNKGYIGDSDKKIPLGEGSSDSLGVTQYKENLNSINIFKANTKLIPRSKKMSREMTKPECNVWFNLLSKKQLSGYKFTKQKIIFNYILDFYCSELLLAVEIDGDTHDIEYDKVRDNFTTSIGIKTLRFGNQDALTNLDGIEQSLQNFIKSKKLTIIPL